MPSNEENDKEMCLVYMPSLIYTLNAHQINKGEALTEAEVDEISSEANVIATDYDGYLQLEESRGYSDIDPMNCWAEWQDFNSKQNLATYRDYVEKIVNPKARISGHINFLQYQPNFFARFFSPISSELVSKFGGRPCLIKQSEWPTSRKTGEKMQFICQIKIDKSLFRGLEDKMIYLFITNNINVPNTNDPEGGENAVIIKSLKETKITRRELFKAKGPSLNKEFRLSYVYKEEADFEDEDWTETQYEEYFKSVDGTKISGNPAFLDRDMAPIGDGWRLLLQIDSSDLPFDLDFGGGGVGYLFINDDCTKGKFLWQCD